MSARGWWLALAVIPAVLLVGALATAVFVVAQEGWDRFPEAPVMSKGGWSVLGAMALFGCLASQPLASAWLLPRAVPGRRPWLLPGLCALSGAVMAVALAWSVQVMHVRGLHEMFVYASLATMLAIPIFAAGLICLWHTRHPERAWFFRPCARVSFAVAIFLGALQTAVPLEMGLFQWNVSRAKAYVEVVAREVERTSVKGVPPEDIAGILASHGDTPRLAAGPGLTYERGEHSFRLEFFCSDDLIKGHFWTYRSPPGTWEKRRY